MASYPPTAFYLDTETIEPVSDDWYVHGMSWTATTSGTINYQTYQPGATIHARGDITKPFLPLSEIQWIVVNEFPNGYLNPTPESSVIIATGLPSAEIVAEFAKSTATVRRRVDLYESDGITPYKLDVGTQSGSVSADMTRSERRNLQVVIDEPSLYYGPGGIWYDKIIKPYRGIRLSDGTVWMTPLGTFLPDSFGRPRFPKGSFTASCRDLSKKLQQVTFANSNNASTTFVAGTLVTAAMQAIALNGGIADLLVTPSTATLSTSTTFVQEDDRWAAILKLAESIAYEAFFDAFGKLVIRPWVDPVTAPIYYTFETGAAGNLVDFDRSTNDSLLKNDVIVRGDSDENAMVFGRAENLDAFSPTSIDNVGRRTKSMKNQFLTDNGAAVALAQAYLAVSGLEQYDLSLSALVVPWLEPAAAVEAILPDAGPYDPIRYLLSSVTIPLAIEAMSAGVKRVVNVG